MRRIVSSAIVTLAATVGYAADITFTSDGLIQDGDVYDKVAVYDTPPNLTTVTMTGGTVNSSVILYDASIFNMTDGFVLQIAALNSGKINIQGGTAARVFALGTGTANVYGGNVGVFGVEAWGSGTVNVYDGSIDYYIAAFESGTINMYGGQIDDFITAGDQSIINFFGYGFTYDPTGGSGSSRPLVSGYWLDGTPFEFHLENTETFDHVRLLPEPQTIYCLLGGLSIIVLRIRKTGKIRILS